MFGRDPNSSPWGGTLERDGTTSLLLLSLPLVSATGHGKESEAYLATHMLRALLLLGAFTVSHTALVSPAYFDHDARGSDVLGEVLATLSVTGLSNRDEAYLWLNASAKVVQHGPYFHS